MASIEYETIKLPVTTIRNIDSLVLMCVFAVQAVVVHLRRLYVCWQIGRIVLSMRAQHLERGVPWFFFDKANILTLLGE